MSRGPWRACALAWLASALPIASCSLVKLSDDVVQGHCEQDSDCDDLNSDRSFGDDPCRRWQCNAREKLCRYGALDADHDGQSPATTMDRKGKVVTCVEDPAKQDCNDGDDEIAAGHDELCDEKDNDCDGRSDEGALQSHAVRAVAFPGIAAAADAAYARDPMSGAVALAYSVASVADARPGLSVLDPELEERASAATIGADHIAEVRAHQVAVAALEGDRFAYAFVNESGPRRLVAGVWRADAPLLGVQEAIATHGVRCAAEEHCDDPLFTGTREIVAPALASEGSDVLLAYLRWSGDAEAVACGELRGGDRPASLLLNLLARPSAEEQLAEQTAEALHLAESSDLAAPALLALPAIGDVPPSWLIAYAETSGDLVVQQVRREGKKIAVVEPELLRIGGSVARSSVALALGPSERDGQVIGIAHRRGCAAAARVVLDLKRLAGDGGRLAVSSIAEGVMVGGASNESAPALVYSPARDVWLVSYQDRSGLRGRVVGRDGTPHGEQPYTMIARVAAEDRSMVDILPAHMAAFDLGADLVTVAHVLRLEWDDPRAFEVVTLSCEDE